MTVPSPLWDLLALPAAIDPSRGLLTFGEVTTTASEAQEWAIEISTRLDGSPVALLDVNSHHAVLLMFACMYRGARFVPLNYRLRKQELEDVLVRAGTPTLVYGPRYADLATDVARSSWGGRIVPISELCDREVAPEGAWGPDINTGANGDVVLFTSGTSRAPKPIPLEAAPLSTYVMATTPACPPETRDESLLMSMPLYHVAGIVAVLRAVFAGRRVTILDQFDAATWIRTVERHQVTHAFLVPTMMQRVLEGAGSGLKSLTSLQTVTYGGGPMPSSIIHAALHAFPASVGFVGVYGLTEASGTVCVLDEADHAMARGGDADAIKRLASVGRPLEDVLVQVQDEHGDAVATGEEGEIVIHGPRLSSVLGGAGSGNRELRTGDLGFLDEAGYLHFCGRADDMIVRGAENIAPLEIEEALRISDQVEEVAVFGVHDETWGHRVVAAVVLAAAYEALDLEALEDECRPRLASYKWPEEFIVLPALPMTPTGKVVKRELAHLVGPAASR